MGLGQFIDTIKEKADKSKIVQGLIKAKEFSQKSGSEKFGIVTDEEKQEQFLSRKDKGFFGHMTVQGTKKDSSGWSKL